MKIIIKSITIEKTANNDKLFFETYMPDVVQTSIDMAVMKW